MNILVTKKATVVEGTISIKFSEEKGELIVSGTRVCADGSIIIGVVERINLAAIDNKSFHARVRYWADVNAGDAIHVSEVYI